MEAQAIVDVINGVDVERLFGTIDDIKERPGLADFRFRLRNKWISGGHNRSTIKNFYGACHQHGRRNEPFVLDADEPPVLVGEDLGPNPVEYALKALVACVTSSLVYHAAARGIRLHEVESRVEGNIDLHGFLGLDDSVPKGFKHIRIKFKIKADVPDAELEELVRLGPTYSPVFDTITRAVPVTVELDP